MMSLHLIAGYVASAVLFSALFVYLRAIHRGIVHSNRVTWGVWVLVNILFVASYYTSVGLVSSIWAGMVYLLATISTFLFLVFFGKPGEWTWVEKVSLMGVFLISIFWFISRSPLAVLTLTLCIDILGAIPLVVTLWKNPKADYGPAWYLGFIANAINLFAVEKWNYANAVYPVYLALLTLTISSLILFPRPREK